MKNSDNKPAVFKIALSSPVFMDLFPCTGTTIFASYRHIDKETLLLENIGYKNIKVVDIYPPEANRWDNTHFYAIVAEK